MNRTEHTGAEWSASFLTGRETRKVFRYVNKATGEQVKGVGSFVGRLRDLPSGADVAELTCVWLENGDIEVTFPDMAEGRYVIAIDHSGQNGEVTRFLNGYAGYLQPEYVIKEITDSDETVITVCCGDNAHEVWALARGAADYVAFDVLKELDKAIAFMDSFNEALRESVQVKENYLWIGGVNTGHYLKGEDGVTPEYRSDGYWYVNGERVGKARGDDGITPHITSDGYWAIGSVKTAVRAEGRDGIDGDAMRRIMIDSVDELPDGEERGVYYYVRKADDTFDVYTYLENAGWAYIGPANDVAALNIATNRVHGMVKFSAGAQSDGAPVGWKAGEDGTAIVPISGMAVAGTGKISTEAVIDFGADVGLDANNAYRVPFATMDRYGSVKVSTNEIIEGTSGAPAAKVGYDSDGRLRVVKAGLNNFGAIRLGSEKYEGMPSGYLVGIGATSDGRLANNYVLEGALQHWTIGSWKGKMAWLDAAVASQPKYENSDAYYSAVLTTVQFTQSQASGLELLPANETGDKCGGVYLAVSMDDDGAATVPTAATVNSWVVGYTYGKGEVYSKTEADDRFLSADSGDGLFVSKDELGDYAIKNGTSSQTTIYRMTQAEFDALEQRDANGIYFIKRA